MGNLVHNSSTIMSPLMLGIKREGTRNLSLLKSLSSGLVLKEHNYLGLSDPNSLSSEGSAAPTMIKENNGSLNLKATELTLGPPQCQSPERDLGLDSSSSETIDEKPSFPSRPSKDGICSSSTKIVVSGNKRVFSDTIGEFSAVKTSGLGEKNWMFKSGISNSEASQSTSQGSISVKSAIDVVLPRSPVDQHPTANETSHNKISSSNDSRITPAAKAQVAGWPPVKVRKCTLADTPKTNIEVDRKQSAGVLYVKVSMNGAPFLIKVDLRSYSTYQELSSALQMMFSCFTLGTCGSQETLGKEIQGESSLMDQIQRSEHVLTFEDQDGDWMLVGDVPWEMFIGSCKKLKIMKGSDAIGLAPGAMEQSKNKN